MQLFSNRKLIIASKHQKELVIQPLFEQALALRCVVDEKLDTDQLGTFSGEIERTLSPLEAAREKCRRAMALNACDMAIASEGSFGPHPSYYFLNANEEFLVFMDLKNDLEIAVRHLSLDTNFNGKEIYSEEELLHFAQEVGFPDHGIIVKNTKENFTSLLKGITQPAILMEAYRTTMRAHGSVYVETDMRAMYNPTRMKVIEVAAKKLLEKVRSCCPACDTPGFEITEATRGLPCARCGAPTPAVKSVRYSCKRCGHSLDRLFPDNKQTEDPMYCSFCNP
ncbi:MAG: hypothetical protein MUF42_03510 [Cytophagaceae bacterium]|jgi:hypothetical protein|nr:hypothetical protein [Cytophagaceae bacterium]